MSDLLLEVKNISKSFRLNENRKDSLKEAITSVFSFKCYSDKQFFALNNVSFKLGKGEVLGIIGKNGAGKSTLLRILSGITQPDSGEINFYGKSASILDVGAGFHPELSGRENVFLAAQLFGLTKEEIERKYQSIVDFSGIQKFIDEPVKNYSAGMYLRLAFAVVAHIDAEVLIFDEVLGVGDAEFQKKVSDYLAATTGKVSFVVVSHNLGSLMKIATRLILMDKGTVIKEGPLSVINDYMDEVNAARKTAHPSANNSCLVELNDSAADVELKRVGVKAVGKNFGDTMLDTDEIELMVELTAPPHSTIDIAFQLSNQFDQPIFATSSLHPASTEFSQSLSGTLTYICIIPADFLNKGMFTLNMFIVKDKQHIIIRKSNILDFPVQLNSAVMNDFFAQQYPGGLKPLHRWIIKS